MDYKDHRWAMGLGEIGDSVHLGGSLAITLLPLFKERYFRLIHSGNRFSKSKKKHIKVSCRSGPILSKVLDPKIPSGKLTITMENHMFYPENRLSWVIYNSYVSHYQRESPLTLESSQQEKPCFSDLPSKSQKEVPLDSNGTARLDIVH